MSSNWLHNNKVDFSVVDINNKPILVCTKSIGQFQLLFIEDLETGKRIFNDKSVSMMVGWGIDKVIKELAEQL